METGVREYPTLDELKQATLLRDVLMSRPLRAVPAFERLEKWLLGLTTLMDHHSVAGSAALIVPGKAEKEGDILRFVDFQTSTHGLSKRAAREANKVASRAQSNLLVQDLMCTATGTVLAWFDERLRRQVLSKPIRRAIERQYSPASRAAKSYSHLYFRDPKKLFKGNFEPTIKGVGAKGQAVAPLLVKEGDRLFVLGALGLEIFDLGNSRSPNEIDREGYLADLTRHIEDLNDLFSSLYWAYYSHLDLPPRWKDWPGEWEDRGRIVSHVYLSNLVKKIATDRTSSPGKGSEILCRAASHRSHLHCLSSYVFLYCDVNGVKKVNDSLGHHVGNELIRVASVAIWQAARSIQSFSCICHSGRPDVVVGRWGGDEFIVILGFEPLPSDPEKIVRKFVRVCRRRLRCGVDALGRRARGRARESIEAGIAVGWKHVMREDIQKEFRRSWRSKCYPPEAEGAMYWAKWTMKALPGFELAFKNELGRRGAGRFASYRVVAAASYEDSLGTLRKLRAALQGPRGARLVED